MALQQHKAAFRRLTPDELAPWRAIPPAVASDCMNRTQVMHARMKSLIPGHTLCGQARTVVSMAGDCVALCMAIQAAESGDILVADAGGVPDTAVWGGIMNMEATRRGLGGVVLDGAVRDVAEIRDSGLVVFCTAIVPRGPHEGFGGIIDGPVSVAGVPVAPGDIVLGNDDGVVVVPLAIAPAVLQASQAHLAKEDRWMADLRAGRPFKEVFSMPDPVMIG